MGCAGSSPVFGNLTNEGHVRINPKLLYWYFACMLVACSAWITHVVTTIMDGRTVLLIAGAIAWPVGVIHGWGIWLGFWP